MIPFLDESLNLMGKLTENIREKLTSHQYCNTVRPQIDIPMAHFIKEVNNIFRKSGNIMHAFTEIGIDLAEIMQSSLISTENLKTVDEPFPRSTTPLIVEKNTRTVYLEILGWATAILASAWSEWIFTSKSNPNSKYQTDPAYQTDKSRQAACVNVRLALPYIKNSIIDAIYRQER
jgi:hypothetical protein